MALTHSRVIITWNPVSLGNVCCDLQWCFCGCSLWGISLHGKLGFAVSLGCSLGNTDLFSRDLFFKTHRDLGKSLLTVPNISSLELVRENLLQFISEKPTCSMKKTTGTILCLSWTAASVQSKGQQPFIIKEPNYVNTQNKRSAKRQSSLHNWKYTSQHYW